MKSKRALAIAASTLAAFASIVLITNQASAADTTSPTAPAVVSQTLPSVAPAADAAEIGSEDIAGDNVQSGDQIGVDVAGAVPEADDLVGGVDADNIQFEDQSGDQSGVDVAGATDTETFK
ncbi:MAG: hypothetical protein Q8K86_08010 [Candidatus Nanopelagicaceae bacterium]|nr:hypothetical protein [Candidatus Nanopelagicaceae bacterium]